MTERSGMFGFIDNVYFKPTANGWLFKEPALWRRRTYLLSDEQKMRLARPMRWMSVVTLILIVAAIQAEDIISDRFHVPLGLSIAVVTAVAVLAAWIYMVVVLRPLLTGLTPTDERITFSDQVRMQAAALPMSLIVVWLVGCLGFVALGLVVGFHDGWDWKAAAGVAFFAILSAYPAALLVLRGRSRARKP